MPRSVFGMAVEEEEWGEEEWHLMILQHFQREGKRRKCSWGLLQKQLSR